MVGLGHAFEPGKFTRGDDLIPPAILEICPVIQQPFHARRFLALVFRVRSRIVGILAHAIACPKGIRLGRFCWVHGFGLVGAQVGNGMIKMREKPCWRTVGVSLRAQKADGVKEMMQTRRERVQTYGAGSINENQAINRIALSLCLQRRFVSAYSTSRPTSKYIRTARLSTTHFGEIQLRNRWYSYDIIFRALDKWTIQTVDCDIIINGRNLSVRPLRVSVITSGVCQNQELTWQSQSRQEREIIS